MLITDNAVIKRSCEHCKNHYPVKKYFYKLDSVDHEDESGFICTAFAAEEGIMIHMDGVINAKSDFCEMFKEREKSENRID